VFCVKNIKVSDKCVACGTCTLMTELLLENANGTVIPAKSGKIADDSVKEFMEVIESCPVGAISLEEAGLVKSQGKQGLLELKELIKKELANYSVPRPTYYRFDGNVSSIPYNSPSGQGRYDYKSDSKATRAGLNEFNRVMYSQRRAIIQQVLAEYEITALKRFAYYEEKEGNYYFGVNKKVSFLIDQLVEEVKEKTSNKIVIPLNFEKIDIGPDHGFKEEFYIYQLCNVETVFVDEIASQLDPLSEYSVYVNTDDIEDYKGRDIYCYQLNEVIETFRKDVLYAIRDIINDSNGIDVHINRVYDKYVESLQEVLNGKANYLNKEIDKYLT